MITRLLPFSAGPSKPSSTDLESATGAAGSDEKLVQRVTETVIPTLSGSWRTVAYTSRLNSDEHVAFVLGRLEAAAPMFVKLHTQDVVAEILERSLHSAIKHIERIGRGVVLYRVPAARNEDRGPQTFGLEQRQILADLGIANFRLLSDAATFDDTLSPLHYARMEADDWC